MNFFVVIFFGINCLEKFTNYNTITDLRQKKFKKVKKNTKIILLECDILIYSNMKKITKKTIAMSLDKNLSDLIDKNITNKSKYIEWLIYQDLKKKEVKGIKEVFI
jgi:hypothetical protein